MLTKAQEKVIDTYVSDKYFDREKLKKYLRMHDTVGNEIFAYCDKGKGHNSDRQYHAFDSLLEDEDGFSPVSIDTFVRRAPFYFYVADDKYEDMRIFTGLHIFIAHSYAPVSKQQEPETLERMYLALEFLFYEKGISLDDIFSYLFVQYEYANAPLSQWVDYINLCDQLGWKDYMPESFISKYNAALEMVGRDPIIYEVDDDPYFDTKMFRNGKQIEFEGTFPMDSSGIPVLRWTNIKVKNAESITTNQEKSHRHSKLIVTIRPTTIIYGKNFYDTWEDDEWYQIYAGPLTMQFDYLSIKERRKKLGFTQQEVADAIGTTVRTYQKWEGGETTPDGHYLLRLMNWLDLPNPQHVTAYTDG